MSCIDLISGLDSSEKVARHMNLKIVKRRRDGEVAVEYYSCGTTIHATTREDINALLADG